MRPVKPFKIKDGVSLLQSNASCKVSFDGKSVDFTVHSSVNISLNDGNVFVACDDDKHKCSIGTSIALIKQSIKYLTENSNIKISLKGVGYKFIYSKNLLFAFLGHSHSLCFDIPDNVVVKLESPEVCIMLSSDASLLKNIAKKIQFYRSPEPYKGKGVYINDEKIVRKSGKTNK